MTKIIQIKNPSNGNKLTARIVEIFKRKISEKAGETITFTDADKSDIKIQLCVSPCIDEEGFTIEDFGDGVKITGHDERGLLYGVGKFLRTSDYANGEFIPGSWRGTSVPDKKVRGIYFATHFYNYYHVAPMEEIREYIEDIALWGFNTVAVWYDMHHYNGIHEPEAVKMIERLKGIFKAAKDIGLKVLLNGIGNEAYADSPVEMRADWTGGHDGYVEGLGSHYHVELCPNKLGAMEMMLNWKRELFEEFSDIGIDFIGLGPYDQGGCTCAECSPWGGNGFVKICKEASKLARECLPGVKIILSTWLFEYFIEGEWNKLAEALSEDDSWVDYIMWDYNTTCRTGTEFIPDPYLAQNGVPEGLPLLGFPEISMFATIPFGGWGANPQLEYLQSMWDSSCNMQAGGFPYSEGRYEDINKAICSQLYWDENKKVDEIVREYITYEFSSELVEDILKAIKMMQSTYVRDLTDNEGNPIEENGKPWGENARFVIRNTEGINEIYEIINRVDKKLAKKVRESWRWRFIYLRSLLDYELLHNNFRLNDQCEEALIELEKMYYANNNTATLIAPTTKRALRIFRAQ